MTATGWECKGVTFSPVWVCVSVEVEHFICLCVIYTRLKGKKCLIALRYQEVKHDIASNGKDDSGPEGLVIVTLINQNSNFFLFFRWSMPVSSKSFRSLPHSHITWQYHLWRPILRCDPPLKSFTRHQSILVLLVWCE